jgi:hypothetical protein
LKVQDNEHAGSKLRCPQFIRLCGQVALLERIRIAAADGGFRFPQRNQQRRCAISNSRKQGTIQQKDRAVHESLAKPEILSPSMEPIIRIHQGPDGYVHFGRKLDEDVWENLPTIAIAKLEAMFPQFAQELMRDSFFGINTLWRPGNDRLTRINACWVDLDLHGRGEMRTIGTVVGGVIDMVQNDKLPRPSLMVHSGRGVWFLWLLVGDDGRRPAAYPEKILLQEAINRELQRRLSGDASACDSHRMIRVPGSSNSKAEPGNEVVEYRFLCDLDARGRGTEYRLEDLAENLGLNPSGRPPRQLTHVGWRALWTYRFQDFQRLREMRGGFREGCRNHAALIYGTIMQHLGIPATSIRNALLLLASECKPPLTDAEVRSVLKGIGKAPYRKFLDSKLADYLRITPEEAEHLPRWAKPKTITEVDTMDATLSTNDRVEYRRNIIRDIHKKHGCVLSYRQLARLMGERGIHVSHVQVMKYCRGMNLPRLQSPQSSLLKPLDPAFSSIHVNSVNRGAKQGEYVF